MPVFCIRQQKSFFCVVKEEWSLMINVLSSVIIRSRLFEFFCFVIEKKHDKVLDFSRPTFHKMAWLFTNRAFRKHCKLTSPHRFFAICIVSLAIFHPHFFIRNPPSANRSTLYRVPARSFAYHARTLMLFYVLPSVCGFSSKRETVRSLLYLGQIKTLLTALCDWSVSQIQWLLLSTFQSRSRF